MWGVKNLLIGVPQIVYYEQIHLLCFLTITQLNGVLEWLAPAQLLSRTRTFAQNFVASASLVIHFHRVKGLMILLLLFKVSILTVYCTQGRTVWSCVFRGMRAPLRFSVFILSVASECLSKLLQITWLDCGLFVTICSHPALKRLVDRKDVCWGLLCLLY